MMVSKWISVYSLLVIGCASVQVQAWPQELFPGRVTLPSAPSNPAVPTNPAPPTDPAPPAAPARCKPGVITSSIRQFDTHLTGYYPSSSAMEGGWFDRAGARLKTLQDYLKGKVSYVSVAMDDGDTRFPYGTRLRIPSIEKEFGRCIEFAVVDTGGAFQGMKSKKLDVCHKTHADTMKGYTNRTARVYVVHAGSVR